MTKLIVTFCNSVNAPKSVYVYVCQDGGGGMEEVTYNHIIIHKIKHDLQSYFSRN